MSSRRSIDMIEATWTGWKSMMIRAAFWGVSNSSAIGSRMALGEVMTFPSMSFCEARVGRSLPGDVDHRGLIAGKREVGGICRLGVEAARRQQLDLRLAVRRAV